MMTLKRCTLKEIEKEVQDLYGGNHIIVDSFWEDHVLKSKLYQLMIKDKCVGFAGIFEEHTLMLFHLFEDYRQLGRQWMEELKRMELVTNAMIPTGDEFFLSHAMDNYQRLEKQAYFSLYRNGDLPRGKEIALELKEMNEETGFESLKTAGDFFEEDTAERLTKEPHLKVYEVYSEEEFIGFGVIEYGRVVKDIASIGMFVVPEKRQQGYARNILKHLQKHVSAKGYLARSGCWYYNHNSLKSIISAGAYSQTRLLRIYF